MSHIFYRYYIFLVGFIFFVQACGIVEHQLPYAIEKGESSTASSFTILQMSKIYQIGDEFILTPSIRTSFGLEESWEISAKTFGLGLGVELKKEIFRQNTFGVSAAIEGDFSFPMMGALVSRFLPINQEFLDFVSTSFYFIGTKVITGYGWKNLSFAVGSKLGYLDNALFLPDMGTYKKTSYPGFVSHSFLSVFFKESLQSSLFLGLETGFIYPMEIIYFSASYHF